jgi:hypothetical protein
MAFLNLLASVSQRQVTAIQKDESAWTESALVVAVSHLLAYWVQAQPIGRLLGEALDGGQQLRGKFDHTLRGPVYHTPEQVRALGRELRDARQAARADAEASRELDGFQGIDKVLRLFAFASDRGDCVISFLDSTTGPDGGEWPPHGFDQQPATPPADDVGASWPAVLWGSLGGAVALGAVGLCCWRYRRFRRGRPDRGS